MKYNMILIPLFLPILLLGQSKVLISSSGSSVQNGRVSESIGQVFTHSKKDNSIFLSEGFQQAGFIELTTKGPKFFAQIYPNPTSSKVQITSIEEIDYAMLFDVNGRIIYTIDNVKNQYLDLSMEPYIQGIYLLKITMQSGKTVLQKIVKN